MPKVEYTATKGLVQLTGTNSFSIDGALSRRTSEDLLQWNYTTSGAPVVTNYGLGDGNGALGASVPIGILLPDNNGRLAHATLTTVGALTTVALVPTIEGTVPAADAGNTAVGLNLQLEADGSTGNNKGCQIHLGSGTNATNANKFTVGTHSGFIDATFWTQDWTDYDCITVGFRKAEPFQTGFGAAIAAETGDPAYSDIFVAGVAGATRQIQSVNALNEDTTAQFVDTTDGAVDSQNLRIKVSLSAAGAASFQYEVNGIAGAGTLQDPTDGAHAFTFDSGDDLIPFISIFKNGNADIEILLKDLHISRSPGVLHVE